MNVFEDANVIYDAGTKAMSGSKWKYPTQFYRMNHLLETAKLQEKIKEHKYQPDVGKRFLIYERGKPRYITSNSMEDKTVYHILSDDVLSPVLAPYIIRENTASQKGKGVRLFREVLEKALHSYYRQHRTNKGYIFIGDFSGYYPNMPHDKCKAQLSDFLDRGIRKQIISPQSAQTAREVISGAFRTFEMDVSRFSDAEIDELYHTKIDPMMNCGIQKEQLTGKKMLKKGVDIGAQPSQDIGVIYPYRIDNYGKIVCGFSYARYSDDFFAIAETREQLLDFLDNVAAQSDKLSLLLNRRKTRIQELSKPFRVLQIQYWLTDTGRVVKKINPKTVTRERRKLKAYRRKLDAGEMTYRDIENSFKSWIVSNYKIMSNRQLDNIFQLYYTLFQRRIIWKKKHGRLHWLMDRALKGLQSLAPTISAKPRLMSPSLPATAPR